MVFHLLPFLAYQPSAFAIAMLAGGPSRRSPVLSVVQAMHERSSPSPVTSKRTGANRPQELSAAMMNVELHEGRPWMMFRFCITASGEAPIRCAISSATMALPMLSFPRYCSGTMLLETSASAMRWADSKLAALLNAVMECAGAGAIVSCSVMVVGWCWFRPTSEDPA